ncbi:hypothetical protein AMK59_4755, partial [Oryctes borbonicus]
MLKMDSEPFKEWINLYDENFQDVWYAEQPQLRNAAMLLRVLDNEFNRIRKLAATKIMQLKNDVNKNKDFLLCAKENKTDNQSFNSPEVFINLTPSQSPTESHTNRGSETVEINKENICTSPKINKASKRFKLKKLKQCNALNYSALNINQSSKNTLPKATDIIDSTIIDKTPETASISKRTKSKYKLNINKRKKSIDGTSTQVCLDIPRSTMDFDNIEQSTSCGHRLKFNDLDKIHKEKNNPKLETKKEPVVRGKERQNLEGWDCRECKEFYEGLNLNTHDTKRILNKCSKHRSKFEQIDYTPRGFWDLNFPPTPPKKKYLSD